MTKQFKIAATVLAAGLPLGGCLTVPWAPHVASNVAVFHTLDQVPKEATFSVVAWRPENDRSLEFHSYALQLTKIISKAGYRTVAPGKPADYIVYFDYGIDNGTPFQYTYNRPQWGVVAQAEDTVTTITDTPTGQVIKQQTTPGTQTFGVTGYTQELVSGTNFNRYVNIDIVPRGVENPLPVMEMRLRSDGQCGSLPTLMPRFLGAIARRFDDKSGKAGNMISRNVDC